VGVSPRPAPRSVTPVLTPCDDSDGIRGVRIASSESVGATVACILTGAVPVRH
jgi:hypothetical protein